MFALIVFALCVLPFLLATAMFYGEAIDAAKAELLARIADKLA